jgi:hypothetical protein
VLTGGLQIDHPAPGEADAVIFAGPDSGLYGIVNDTLQLWFPRRSISGWGSCGSRSTKGDSSWERTAAGAGPSFSGWRDGPRCAGSPPTTIGPRP